MSIGRSGEHLLEGSAARKAFEEEALGNIPLLNFQTYRGLRNNPIQGVAIVNGFQDPRIYEIEGYNEELPTLNGKDFITLVNDKIQERQESARKTGTSPTKVVIVDVGYGSGKFLLDSRKEWGESVDLIGFGLDIYTKIPIDQTHIARSKLDNKDIIIPVFPPTAPLLAEAGVRLIKGNVLDIDGLGEDVADFIVTSNVLMHVPYPDWELIKKFYKVLKPNGTCFIKGGKFDIRRQDRSILKDYLTRNGYYFEGFSNGSLSFQKTSPSLENAKIKTIRESRPWTNDILQITEEDGKKIQLI